MPLELHIVYMKLCSSTFWIDYDLILVEQTYMNGTASYDASMFASIAIIDTSFAYNCVQPKKNCFLLSKADSLGRDMRGV